jgi:hypothetical protein
MLFPSVLLSSTLAAFAAPGLPIRDRLSLTLFSLRIIHTSQ